MKNGNDEPEWLLPIDLMADSYAPEQIADELGRRHALHLREAQRLVHDRLPPDEAGLADGVRAETLRYLASQPIDFNRPGIALFPSPGHCRPMLLCRLPLQFRANRPNLGRLKRLLRLLEGLLRLLMQLGRPA